MTRRARRLDDRAHAAAARARLLQCEQPLRGRDDARSRCTAGTSSAPCRAPLRCRGRCGTRARAEPAPSPAHRGARPRTRRAPRPRRRCRAGRAAAAAAPPPPPPKMPPKMSPRSKSPKSNVVPPPARRGRSSSPTRSYCFALLGVGEHVVGALHLLEPLLVPGVRVRVHLADELAVRLLDLVLRRVLRDAQRFVEGLSHPLPPDHDPRGPQDAVAEPVALLQRPGSPSPPPRRRAARGAPPACAGRTCRRSGSRPAPPSRARPRTARWIEADALLELRFLVCRGELERTLEVVEDRDELLDEPLVGARGQLLLVARHPLAVVVELGLQPLERVEVLVALLPSASSSSGSTSSTAWSTASSTASPPRSGGPLTRRRPRTRRPRRPRRPTWRRCRRRAAPG